MTLDYSKKGQVTIDMRDYVTTMIQDFPQDVLERTSQIPWDGNLFKVEENSIPLNQKLKEQFHKTTYQALFLCKQGRPDIMPGVAFLTTHIINPTQSDWNKLVKLMRFIKHTKNDMLTLEPKNLQEANWHADVTFAVHPDFCSHTGINLSFGKGTVTGVSRK